MNHLLFVLFANEKKLKIESRRTSEKQCAAIGDFSHQIIICNLQHTKVSDTKIDRNEQKGTHLTLIPIPFRFVHRKIANIYLQRVRNE